jgi:CHASE2 domain-containing sensor protein
VSEDGNTNYQGVLFRVQGIYHKYDKKRIRNDKGTAKRIIAKEPGYRGADQNNK